MLATGTSCLALVWVIGRRRVPAPPARMRPFTAVVVPRPTSRPSGRSLYPRGPVSPRVRAVVLNFNGGRHVIDCVEALRRTDWPAADFEVVVVDNASTDGSDGELRRRFPDLEIRPTGANLGFPANNVAMGDLDGVRLRRPRQQRRLRRPRLAATAGRRAATPTRARRGLSPDPLRPPVPGPDHRPRPPSGPAPVTGETSGSACRGSRSTGEDVWRDAQRVAGVLGHRARRRRRGPVPVDPGPGRGPGAGARGRGRPRRSRCGSASPRSPPRP